LYIAQIIPIEEDPLAMGAFLLYSLKTTIILSEEENVV
jgi:hypothetical protein